MGSGATRPMRSEGELSVGDAAADGSEVEETESQTRRETGSGVESQKVVAASPSSVAAEFNRCVEMLQRHETWSHWEREEFLGNLKEAKKKMLADAHDEHGNTLLILVSMARLHDSTEELLRQGADPDHQNTAGFSSLHYCSGDMDTSIAQLLLRYGANPNVMEATAGCAPLHYAASENNRRLCDLLIEKGGNVTLRCKNGFLPEAYARASGHDSLGDYLHESLKNSVSEEVKAKIARLESTGGHGWQKHLDTKTGRYFYFNHRTLKSTWDRPVEMDKFSNDQGEIDVSAFEGKVIPRSPDHPPAFSGRRTSERENQKLQAELDLMRQRLNEAKITNKRQSEEVERMKKLTKEADDRFAKQLASLKDDLEGKRADEEERNRQIDLLKEEFKRIKEKEIEDLRAQFECERQEQIAQIEKQREEERLQHQTVLEQRMFEMQQLEEQLAKELKEKKQYYNEIEELKGSIRVCARVRPLLQSEIERGCENVLEVFGGKSIKMLYRKTDKGGEKVETKTWNFDHAFNEKRSQQDVFEDTKRLIQSAIDGFNVCIFAYGQTGAGKTYTISGTSNEPGIHPRAVQTLFQSMKEQENLFKFSLELYMCELHLDTLVDLLAEQRSTLPMQIKKDSFGVVYVENITVVPIESEKELLEKVKMGEQRRTTDSTMMNDESSRSHLIISIVIKSENIVTGEITSGKLTLVDLAGSERVKKSGAEGQTFNEATSINKALSALGEVINALTTNAKHIPYRNNPLTQLMSDSLGGNAKTLMIVNVSPADYNTNEAIASLNFASRCKNVHNAASKGFETKELNILRREIQKLRMQNK